MMIISDVGSHLHCLHIAEVVTQEQFKPFSFVYWWNLHPGFHRLVETELNLWNNINRVQTSLWGPSCLWCPLCPFILKTFPPLLNKTLLFTYNFFDFSSQKQAPSKYFITVKASTYCPFFPWLQPFFLEPKNRNATLDVLFKSSISKAVSSLSCWDDRGWAYGGISSKHSTLVSKCTKGIFVLKKKEKKVCPLQEKKKKKPKTVGLCLRENIFLPCQLFMVGCWC